MPGERYQIIRSKRKSISIQVNSEGQVIVRCPQRMRELDVILYVESKRDWIEKQIAEQKRRSKQPKLTQVQIEELAKQAKTVIPQRVAYYAPRVGVTYGRITIRNQKTLWGSCSSNGNLNFNCLLMLVPAEVRDYVVVHELCHRKEMNHSAKYWAEVERVMPNYRIHRKWLKENGPALIAATKSKE